MNPCKEKKWIRPLALALGLPSTSFATAYFCWLLVEKNTLSREQAFFLFFAVVLGTLFGIVRYAFGDGSVVNTKKIPPR